MRHWEIKLDNGVELRAESVLGLVSTDRLRCDDTQNVSDKEQHLQ